jgi:hypothetical protein
MFSDGIFCPECNTDSLHRSHRRGRDWFFYLIGFRPVRCSCCCHRFYVPRPARDHSWRLIRPK